ncbi:MAG: cytochrome-c peroxidase [Saprospiraceae bacterium]|nr:cytochrome-c peroxidase [Saprospiraceae bacterium]
MKKILYILFIANIIQILSCKDGQEDAEPNQDLTSIPYNPLTYQITYPSAFPQPSIPSDNPITNDGILLGRHLFFDPILSSDSSMSCASCHHPEKNFTDGVATSKGVLGQFGTRSSMSIMNSVYTYSGFFGTVEPLHLKIKQNFPLKIQ